MTEAAGSERFKTIQDLMHEMVALWQRLTELEESDREHRRALEALQASENRLRGIVGALPLRLFFKDVGLTYALCNELYSLDWDMRAGELAGKSDRDLFAVETADRLAEIELEVIRTGRTEIAEEDRLVAGREVTFLAIRKPVVDAEGNTLGVLGILQDITEDKRQREALERRIHELQGALSERVGQVGALESELEKTSAEHRQAQEEFSRLRAGLESEIAALKESLAGKTALLEQKEEEFTRVRAEMESELQIRREEIHRLRNELQKEMYERAQAVEALKKSVAHSQELLESVQKLADIR
ncbi:MAG TPA: PAS domain-containing protein [Syntrophales bacterium]|nr:PAS domain-containing protein [Syntrophales bacterium]